MASVVLGSPARDFERALVPHLRACGFEPVSEPSTIGVDFALADQSVLLEVKASFGGFREVDSAVMGLALTCQRLRPTRAILALWSAKLSVTSVRERWLSLTSVLASDIRKPLQLVVATKDQQLVVPDDPRGEQIARALRTVAESLDPITRRPDRSFEVLMVLLSRWLRREGPIAIQDLQRVTGLSHPTVSAQLRALGTVVGRTTNRSVVLREFPTQAWEQLVALARRIRQSRAFVDQSGRSKGVGSLVQRVRQKRWKNVAIGGVVAVRNHWHREVDLAGTPRLDLEVHAPLGPPDLSFVERIDPALQPVGSDADVPVLVVHAVTRAESLFVDDAPAGTRWADPVEVLLDLADLRLGDQADDLVRHLRGS